MSLSVLTSCSKDDGRRGPEANLKSVSGTEWISTKETLRFNNGRYTLDCVVPCYGTYTQNGNRIKFDGMNCVLSASSVTIEEGVISRYGDSMDVTFKDNSLWNTGEVKRVRFTYNILKN